MRHSHSRPSRPNAQCAGQKVYCFHDCFCFYLDSTLHLRQSLFDIWFSSTIVDWLRGMSTPGSGEARLYWTFTAVALSLLAVILRMNNGKGRDVFSRPMSNLLCTAGNLWSCWLRLGTQALFCGLKRLYPHSAHARKSLPSFNSTLEGE